MLNQRIPQIFTLILKNKSDQQSEKFMAYALSLSNRTEREIMKSDKN